VENSLHPNLARIAAAYQQILGRLSRDELDLVHAHSEIRDLIARDDQGVQWTINPRDGGWLFLSRNGEWMPATPPRSGFATMTPHDLREMNGETPVAYNPDWDITLTKVEPAVRTALSLEHTAGVWRKVALVAAVAAVAALLWSIATRSNEEIAPGAPQPAVTTLAPN
jgi:hypothetical protein